MQQAPRGERVCVIAPNGSGKSALVIQFVNNHFFEDYDQSNGVGAQSATEREMRRQIRVCSPRCCSVAASMQGCANIRDETSIKLFHPHSPPLVQYVRRAPRLHPPASTD